MTVAEIVEKARALSLKERQELITLLQDTVMAEINTPEHSILELAGLGAEIWQGVDPQEYVNQLRSEWDDHP